MSAELNGIVKLYSGQLNNIQDYHLLLCTDTWLGEITAIFVVEWLRAKGFTVEIKRQVDLQTKDITSFQIALSDIVSWCENTVERLILINERIDQLAKNLETGGQYNPLSLNLKPLKGNPCPPSTHEVDAWADQDAKRIFGHYNNNCFVLDKLDRGLH